MGAPRPMAEVIVDVSELTAFQRIIPQRLLNDQLRLHLNMSRIAGQTHSLVVLTAVWKALELLVARPRPHATLAWPSPM